MCLHMYLLAYVINHMSLLIWHKIKRDLAFSVTCPHFSLLIRRGDDVLIVCMRVCFNRGEEGGRGRG